MTLNNVKLSHMMWNYLHCSMAKIIYSVMFGHFYSIKQCSLEDNVLRISVLKQCNLEDYVFATIYGVCINNNSAIYL